MILRTLLGSSVLVLGALTSLSCGAHAGTSTGGGGVTADGGGTTGPDGPASSSFSCTDACNRLASAGCPQTNCVALCQQSFGTVPGACASQLATLSTCVQTTPVNCMSSGFGACSPQAQTVLTCIAMNMSTGTDGGTGFTDLGTNPVDTGSTGVDTGSTGDGTCASACARVASACPGSAGTSCNSTCSQLGSVPASCTSQVNSLIACAQTSSIACTGSNPFSSCTNQVNALAACLGVGTDAGTGVDTGTTGDPCVGLASCSACTAGATCGWCNGRCYNGTASGPNGATCADTWAWTSTQCPAM